MSIKERLNEDAKTAMKSQDRLRLDVIRMVRAQVKNVEIARKRELTDEETIDVLVSAVKARREALDFAVKGNRDDLAQKAEQEIQILESYLPQPLSEAELKELVARMTQETGASGPKDMGRVMAAIMPHVKGRADGKLVNAMVRDALAG